MWCAEPSPISVPHDTDNTLASHDVSDSSTTIDGAKKVDGIKRHVLVDSVGVLIAAVVTAADVQDGRIPEAAARGQTHRSNHQARVGGQGLHRQGRLRRRRCGCHRGRRVRAETGCGFIVQPRR